MNPLIRKFERESGLEIYGLGARRERWESALAKYAELVVQEVIEQGQQIQSQTIANGSEEYIAGREMGIEVFMNQIKQHFKDKERLGWVCPKCSADRTKIACPLGFGAQVDGRCPMTVEAQ
jgi:hypothetical protein